MVPLLENKTARMTAVGIGLMAVVFGSLWLINRNGDVKEEISPEIILEESKMMPQESPRPGMTEEEKAAIDAVFEWVGAEMTLLSDVTGGASVGTAFRALEAGSFYYKVEASDLPALEKGFFYEGWLVSQDGFFSTGRMAVTDGNGKLYFQAVEDKSAFNGVVITLEPEDGDPAPDKHILEGSF